MRALLDPFAETADAVATQALLRDTVDFQPGGVDVFPHVSSDPPAHGVGVAARGLQAAVDARRIGRIEGEEVQHALGVQRAVALQVIIQGAGNQQRQGQLFQAIATAVLWHQRQRVADFKHAREVFRALQVARHPVQIRGSS